MRVEIKKVFFNVTNQLRKYKYLIGSLLLLACLVSTWLVWREAENKYEALLSKVVFDTNGVPISISPNSKGHYVYEVSKLPDDFKEVLLKKEDQYFRYHLGVNPLSIMRAIFTSLTEGQAGGASTLTQQLAKNLLGTETERNIWNKMIESIYALSIEIYTTKDEILLMYTNLAYLGNQLQGFETASLAYFDKALKDLTHSEQISLLATLSYPSSRNPWAEANSDFSKSLNDRISPDLLFTAPETTEEYSFQQDSFFELRTAGLHCDKTCTSAIDDSVTRAIREVLDRHVTKGLKNNIRNGAVVVINPRTEELIAMVGSRDPSSDDSGNQINMAIEPRPIGSTVKPFIYAKAFEKGLRPYTFVEDREYKYPIATGFSLYPKNYDGQYRGQITLHEALSNSLNVPSVKALEYIGLDNFYDFLSEDLKFEPIQDYQQYQYGIALGGLEMDLLTLTHYFTLFPRGGSLAPLRILKNNDENFDLPPQSHLEQKVEVIDREFIELVHVILSDRFTGVNQFGLEGNLNLTQDNYGVKTGTSRDFHDSWVVGYTGDFVVGVWLGNSENKPLNQVSGASGAGAVWHDVMQYLLTTSYNQDGSFKTKNLERIFVDGNEEWGIVGDVLSEHQNLLIEDNLILSPHEGDVFEFGQDLTIPLQARKDVQWSVNGQKYETKSESSFVPYGVGTYEIQAQEPDGRREIVLVKVITE